MKTLFDKEEELGKRMISCIEDYVGLVKRAEKARNKLIYIPTNMSDYDYMLIKNHPEKLRTNRKVKAYVLKDALRNLIDKDGTYDEDMRFIVFNIETGVPINLVNTKGHSLLPKELNDIKDIKINQSLKYADKINKAVEKTIKGLEEEL